MKSALKKVLSLMLVAMLLVSAIPFQVSASDTLDDTVISDDTALSDGTVLSDDTALTNDASSDDSLSDANVITDDADTDQIPEGFDPSLIMPMTELGGGDNIPVEKTKVSVTLNGSKQTLEIDKTTTLKGVIEIVFGDYSNYNVKMTVDGKEEADFTKTVADAASIVITTTLKNVEITLTVDGKTRLVYEPYNSTITLNEALLKKWGAPADKDQKVSAWKTDNNGVKANKANGEKLVVDWNLKLEPVFETVTTPKPTNPTDGTTISNSINFLVKVDGVAAMDEVAVTPSNGKDYATVENMIKYYFDKDWASKYTFSHYWIKGETGVTHDGESVLGDQIPVGNTVHVALTTKGTSTPTTKYTVRFYSAHETPRKLGELVVSKGQKLGSLTDINSYAAATTPAGYEFLGWKTSRSSTTYIQSSDIANRAVYDSVDYYAGVRKVGSSTGSTEFNPKLAKDAWLYIHDPDVANASKYITRVKLNNWACVKNLGKVDLADVHSIVNSVLTTKNGGKIPYEKLDGIYRTNADTEIDYLRDQGKQTSIDNINELRMEDFVVLHVWITDNDYRVKNTSNNNSNSTNPKTGDSVVMTVSALGITASALAAAYYVSKKRMAK